MCFGLQFNSPILLVVLVFCALPVYAQQNYTVQGGVAYKAAHGYMYSGSQFDQPSYNVRPVRASTLINQNANRVQQNLNRNRMNVQRTLNRNYNTINRRVNQNVSNITRNINQNRTNVVSNINKNRSRVNRKINQNIVSVNRNTSRINRNINRNRTAVNQNIANNRNRIIYSSNQITKNASRPRTYVTNPTGGYMLPGNNFSRKVQRYKPQPQRAVQANKNLKMTRTRQYYSGNDQTTF